MALTFNLLSVHDLFGKLRRDADALEDEVTSDRLFNFVITGHSLIDWVVNDPSVPLSAKDPAVIEKLRSNAWLKICGNLANGCKHFTLNRGDVVVSSTTVEQGYGAGRYGKGGYGVGEESIKIELNDGTMFHCLDLVNNILSTWEVFFNAHGL